MRFTLVISLILAILAVVFALQNPGVTNVQIFGFGYEGSKALVLLITFAIGVFVGVLATVPAYFRNRRKVRSLRKTIAEERSETHRRSQDAETRRAQEHRAQEHRTTDPADTPPEAPPSSSPESSSPR